MYQTLHAVTTVDVPFGQHEVTQFVEPGVAIALGAMRPELPGILLDLDFLATHAKRLSQGLPPEFLAEPLLDLLLGLLRPPRRKHLRESLPVGLGLNGTRAEELVKVLRPNLLLEPFLDLLIRLPGPLSASIRRSLC